MPTAPRPRLLDRGLELRVLAFWGAELGVDPAVLDADGLVVVRDPRDFAAARRALIRTARGAFVLAAPDEAEAARAGPEAFALDAERRARGVGLLHYLDGPVPPPGDRRVRLLGAGDRPLLEELQRAAGAEETEEAEVDVEHPLAVGIVDGGRLLAVASLLEEGGDTVDVGVLVHPGARGRGLGAAAVADASARAHERGRLVQYRCNLGNEASARLARACGFALWGVLSVAPPPDALARAG